MFDPNVAPSTGGPGTRRTSSWAQPELGPQIGAAQLALPPEVFPPGDAVDFICQGRVAGAAVGGWVDLDTVQLDQRRRGIIRDVELIASGTITPTDVLEWRITFDQTPVEGWTVDLVPRIAGSLTRSFLPASTFIRVPRGALIALQYRLTAGGPLDVAGSLRGWSWADGN